jgi:hypothetical protein
MDTKSRKINEINRLEKIINMWTKIGDMAYRIVRLADGKACGYAYEQDILIDEIAKDRQYIDLRAKEEYNRRNFKIETDL